MRYKLIDIINNHSNVLGKALSSGKLSSGNAFIDLSSDFNFEGVKPQFIEHKDVVINRTHKPIEATTDWPLVLKPLKLLAKDGDRGMGDIVERMIGKDNSKDFQEWFRKHFGVACGCNERKEYLNQRYPLK